jgi:predicted nucleotidyltransferase
VGLAARRVQTDARIDQLRKELREAEELAAGIACVYATGSFGRGEASGHSDLDLFILAKNHADGKSSLRKLDEIRIKADLIEVAKKLGFPEFSRDGQYLDQHTLYEFTHTLGTEHDDVTNTFTARLLLLLESCPLLEKAVYEEVLGDVVAAYWRDYEDHKSDFIPAFLANDILRLWRTFCVNYEARTTRQPDSEKAKGKIKNYKLKHSRMLTCYSGLLYLLAVYGHQETVHPSDALSMIRLSPTQRLEWLREQPYLSSSRATMEKLLDQYELFLGATNASEDELVTKFLDKKTGRGYLEAAYKFGDLMFEALNSVGQGNRFHRLLVV